jgi:rhodanese-related sulfurtransferase
MRKHCISLKDIWNGKSKTMTMVGVGKGGILIINIPLFRLIAVIDYNKEKLTLLGDKLGKRYYLWVIMTLVIMVSVLPGCTGEKQLTSSNIPQAQDVTPQEAFNLIQENKDNPDFVILDVRTLSEFTDGHIAGALNIDVNLLSFRGEIAKLNRNDSYLVYCRTGNRSRTALAIMGELGFTHIYHLKSGITEWTGSGLPVVQ